MRKKQVAVVTEVAAEAVPQVVVTEADFHEPALWLSKLYMAAGGVGVRNFYFDVDRSKRVKVKIVMESV